jgi:ABC-2 type transport system ATP-binding protein
MRFRGRGALVAITMALGLAGGGVSHAETRNGTAMSFDATKIAYTVFLPAGASATNQVPVIFVTHGWGGSRATADTDGSVKPFLDAGYAVLTWDARGFGVSGGEANVDSQEFEVRDVQALIDVAGGIDEIAKDAEMDPRMGMYGGSYAGGIQLMTASADRRVDAIAPEIAWNDLPYALKPNGTLKLGWDELLYGAGLATAATGGLSAQQTGVYAAQIHQSEVEGAALNDWTTDIYDWFNAKSPKHYVNGARMGDGSVLPGVRVPMLVIQGTSDTLFNLNQGIANYNAVGRNGVPTKMIWFCGGHTLTPLGTSCAAAGNRAVITSRVVSWMDRYVKAQTSVDTGPNIEYQLQDGTFGSIASLPSQIIGNVDETTRVSHYGAPTSGQAAAPTAAGCVPKHGSGDLTKSTAQYAQDTVDYAKICQAPTGSWLPITTFTGPPPEKCGTDLLPCVPTPELLKPGATLLGSPHLQVKLTSASPEAIVFFKLIDYERATNKATVVDDQEVPLRAQWLSLSTPQAFSFDMPAVSWRIQPGHEIYLEVAPNSNAYANSRIPGNTTVAVKAAVPGLAPAGELNDSSFDFGGIAIGQQSASHAFTVTNSGNAPLAVSGLTLTGTDAKPTTEFAIASDACTGATVAVGSSCTFSAKFTPTKLKGKIGIVTVQSNGAVPFVTLYGTGLPLLNPTPAPLAFGDVATGTPSTLTVTYTNLDAVPVTVGALTIGGTNKADFTRSADACGNATLAPGASCTVDITFRPAAAGTRTAALQVTGNKDATLAMNGTGV